MIQNIWYNTILLTDVFPSDTFQSRSTYLQLDTCVIKFNVGVKEYSTMEQGNICIHIRLLLKCDFKHLKNIYMIYI